MVTLIVVSVLFFHNIHCFQRVSLLGRRIKLGARARTSCSMIDVMSNPSALGETHSLSFEVAGKVMTFETGRLGRQASGAVVASVEDSMVYSTVCLDRETSEVDFTPLRVDWFARYSAVGQTVGAFHRRDSRGDDTEILVARLIDRPLRPMIKEGWSHETQILTHVLSYDRIHPLEALSICAASAAMAVSAVPMVKPIAGVEVGIVDGNLKVNPTKQEKENSTLSLVMAGTKDGILMIEGEADFLPEETLIEALTIGHTAIGIICDAISEFSNKVGKQKKLDTLYNLPDGLIDSIDQIFGDEIEKALKIGDKHERGKAVSIVESKIREQFVGASDASMLAVNDAIASDDTLEVVVIDDEGDVTEPPVLGIDEVDEDEASELASVSATTTTTPLSIPDEYLYTPLDIKKATKKLLVRRLRAMILKTGQRSDGRGVEDVRSISIEHNLLPRTHGSSLFTRGETQALATATLGGKGMEARYENLDELSTKSFYLQYRFPPSSVGEVGRVGGINRRETGHGNLAERALLPCIPDKEKFPYTIRAESLVTESCGSSSMATVCGCCLAMLDAGVPLKAHIAGVAMGLILGETQDEEPVILTDILGLEDALGTMDFKIAGDNEGITSFQLDIKSEGLTLSILKRALKQAHNARLHILEKMRKAVPQALKMKDTIPRILEFSIPGSAIGKIIGPKGKTIQTLTETHEVTNINIEEVGNEGVVQIESFDDDTNQAAKDAVLQLVKQAAEGDDKKGNKRMGRRGKDSDENGTPKGSPPETGQIYRGCKIVSVLNFGVFVEVTPGYEGLVHVSELETKRIVSPEAAGFKADDTIDVKMIGKNDKGQLRLSRRAVLMRDEGKDPQEKEKTEMPKA
jgi:polyribonucleotide nucleotidyltransferase